MSVLNSERVAAVSAARRWIHGYCIPPIFEATDILARLGSLNSIGDDGGFSLMVHKGFVRGTREEFA